MVADGRSHDLQYTKVLMSLLIVFTHAQIVKSVKKFKQVPDKSQ